MASDPCSFSCLRSALMNTPWAVAIRFGARYSDMSTVHVGNASKQTWDVIYPSNSRDGANPTRHLSIFGPRPLRPPPRRLGARGRTSLCDVLVVCPPRIVHRTVADCTWRLVRFPPADNWHARDAATTGAMIIGSVRAYHLLRLPIPVLAHVVAANVDVVAVSSMLRPWLDRSAVRGTGGGEEERKIELGAGVADSRAALRAARLCLCVRKSSSETKFGDTPRCPPARGGEDDEEEEHIHQGRVRRGRLVRVRRMRSTFTATSADRSTGKRGRATGRWWGHRGYNRNGTRGGASHQTSHYYPTLVSRKLDATALCSPGDPCACGTAARSRPDFFLNHSRSARARRRLHKGVWDVAAARLNFLCTESSCTCHRNWRAERVVDGWARRGGNERGVGRRTWDGLYYISAPQPRTFDVT
ncbi:hypothetical protein K438DRAFT_1783942 [Mycena galopus ATCC 62051]|nr:hypothetical protein K438DRAFT_1783942 [Mycena galopus ATCC 62051]